MELQTCPHCGVRVVPRSDNVCPSCQRSFSDPRDEVPQTGGRNASQPGQPASVVAELAKSCAVAFAVCRWAIHRTLSGDTAGTVQEAIQAGRKASVAGVFATTCGIVVGICAWVVYRAVVGNPSGSLQAFVEGAVAFGCGAIGYGVARAVVGTSQER